MAREDSPVGVAPCYGLHVCVLPKFVYNIEVLIPNVMICGGREVVR